MPIGSFKLNAISRYLVPAGGGGDITLDAVKFDQLVDDYRSSTFTTSSDYVVSTKFTGAAWIKIPNFDTRKTIFTLRTGSAPLLFAINTNGSTRVLSTGLVDTSTPAGTISAADTWFHIAYSFDTTDTNKRWVYINGVQVTTSTWGTYSSVGTFLAASSTYLVGMANNPDGGAVGGEADIELSQVWIDNSYIDLSTNISKFYNNGPVDMGSNGTASGLTQPLIYHYGDTASSPTFQTNGGRTSTNKATYTFTVNGTPTDATGPTVYQSSYIAVGGSVSPYLEFYKYTTFAGDGYTKLSDPATMPTTTITGVEFSPSGEYVAAAASNSPWIYIYKRSGDTFTKLSDPATIPSGACLDISWDPTSTYLYVTTSASPYIIAYKRSGDTFTKLSDPATLPDTECRGVHTDDTGTYIATCPRTSATATLRVYKKSGDTLTHIYSSLDAGAYRSLFCDFSPNANYLAVGHESAPYVLIYKRSGDTFTKITSPFTGSTLSPSSNTRSAIFSPDGRYMVIQQQTAPYNVIFKRSGDTWQSVSSSSDVGTWNGDGANWDLTSTYLTLSGSTTPFIKTYKRSGDVFTGIANPGTLPTGALRDGAWYPSPYSSARTPKLINAFGNAQIDTAQFKYGVSSALFDGNNDALLVYDNSGSFNFGTDDFTIEMWVRWSTVAASRLLDGRQNTSGNNTILFDYTGSALRYYTTGSARISYTWTPTAGTWYHISLVRSSGISKIYLDGSEVGTSYTDSTNIQFYTTDIGSTFCLFAGANSDGVSVGTSLNGWADEIRISNIARYTANFTAPAAAFTNDANTLLLIHANDVDATINFVDDNGI